MDERVYRVVEVTGASADGVDEAINAGIRRVNKTMRNVEWFEVIDTRGRILDGEIAQFQVTMKVGFRLED